MYRLGSSRQGGGQAKSPGIAGAVRVGPGSQHNRFSARCWPESAACHSRMPAGPARHTAPTGLAARATVGNLVSTEAPARGLPGVPSGLLPSCTSEGESSEMRGAKALGRANTLRPAVYATRSRGLQHATTPPHCTAPASCKRLGCRSGGGATARSSPRRLPCRGPDRGQCPKLSAYCAPCTVPKRLARLSTARAAAHQRQTGLQLLPAVPWAPECHTNSQKPWTPALATNGAAGKPRSRTQAGSWSHDAVAHLTPCKVVKLVHAFRVRHKHFSTAAVVQS